MTDKIIAGFDPAQPETMVLVKHVGEDTSPRFLFWAEQPPGTGFRALADNIAKAFETDDFWAPEREADVIEVQVIRRTKVRREIGRSVTVRKFEKEAA